MADTRAQVEAEKWIRENALPKRFNQRFRQRSLLLRSKGEFKFDAVSDDGTIVVVISTSAGITAGGKFPSAKLHKIRSDAFWFLLLEEKPKQCVMVFTEASMLALVKREKEKGRFPEEFEAIKVDLPQDLAEKVAESQRAASKEVSP